MEHLEQLLEGRNVIKNKNEEEIKIKSKNKTRDRAKEREMTQLTQSDRIATGITGCASGDGAWGVD